MAQRDPAREEKKQQAVELFEKYFSFGFFGADEMIVNHIGKKVGWISTPQSFHKVYQRWLKKKIKESGLEEQLKKLKEEIYGK